MKRNKALAGLSREFRAYAIALCRDAVEAEDLVQEAYARAFAAHGTPEREADLRPWMFRIIRNLHIDTVRKSRVRMEYVAEQKRLLGDAGADASDIVQDLIVRDAYQAVTPEHREILFLVDIMGMRYGEAAAVLDVPQGTVMSRLSRARRALMNEMESGTVRTLPVHRKKTRS